MERMTYYILAEAVTTAHRKYRELLPHEMQLLLDDLVDIHLSVTVCNALARSDDKALRIYERSVMHLVDHFLDELPGK